jgi:hypothetical protein
MFLQMTENQAQKAYSASKLRVLAATGILFQVGYSEHVKVFSPLWVNNLSIPANTSHRTKWNGSFFLE